MALQQWRNISILLAFLSVQCSPDKASQIARGVQSADQPVPSVPTQIPQPSDEISIHVSPTGSDDSSGDEGSPLRSPSEGLQRLAKLVGKKTLLIHAGTYRLTETLRIGAAQGFAATDELTIRANSDEPVIFSAGTAADNWTKSSDHLFSIKLPANANRFSLWGASAAQTRFHRSRTPNFTIPQDVANLPRIGSFHGGDYHQLVIPFSFSFGGILNYSIPYTTQNTVTTPEFQIVIPMGWNISRIPIANYLLDLSAESVWLAPVTSAGQLEFGSMKTTFGPYHDNANQQAFWLEGSVPDSEGEFAFNASNDTVSVYSTASLETLANSSFGSDLETILSAQGIASLTIEGIEFAHTSWQGYSAGYIGASAAGTYYTHNDTRASLPVAVSVKEVSRVRITDCIFRDMSTSGIEIESGDVFELNQCLFKNISGNAAQVKSIVNANITENKFEMIGEDFSGDAIQLSYCENALVQKNTLYQIAARAVYSVGKPYIKLEPTTIVTQNLIDSALLQVIDAGVINTGGGNLAATENYIKNIRKMPWGTIGVTPVFYFDIYSRGNLASNNITENIDILAQSNCSGEHTLTHNLIPPDARETYVSYGACTIFSDDQYLQDLMTRFDVANCTATGTCAGDSTVSNNSATHANTAAIQAAAGASW